VSRKLRYIVECKSKALTLLALRNKTPQLLPSIFMLRKHARVYLNVGKMEINLDYRAREQTGNGTANTNN